MAKAIHIKAKFRGHDGSMGFTHGMGYTIRIAQKPGGPIYVTGNGTLVEYDTVIGLIENWAFTSLEFSTAHSKL